MLYDHRLSHFTCVSLVYIISLEYEHIGELERVGNLQNQLM